MAAIGTRKLTMSLDAEDVTPDVSTCEIHSGETDADFVSFAQAASGGGRDYSLHLTFVQDAASGSLWDRIWSHAGEDVDVIVRPYGNATPTAEQPHFTGTVTIVEPDGVILGGEADASTTQRFTVDVEWLFTEKPTRVTA